MMKKGGDTTAPEGFLYEPDVLPADEERELVERIPALPLKGVRVPRLRGKAPHGVVRLALLLRRAQAAGGGGDPRLPSPRARPRRRLRRLGAGDLPHVLVTEYGPGAAIGWHKDKAVFGDVIGISLLSPCVFRLRRKNAPKWERYSLTAEPRSAYLMRGLSRTEWEHSIPGVDSLRYSLTFRTLRAGR